MEILRTVITPTSSVGFTRLFAQGFRQGLNKLDPTAQPASAGQALAWSQYGFLRPYSTALAPHNIRLVAVGDRTVGIIPSARQVQGNRFLRISYAG